MTKMNKENQSNQETVTMRVQNDLDLSRMTRDYFYFDILNQDVDEIKIPTVQEITFLGSWNASDIRRHFRNEEEKLQKIIRGIRREIATLGENTEKLHLNPNCDWHGYCVATEDLTPTSMERMTPTQIKEAREQAKRVGECRFGYFTTMWCEKAPCTKCDHHCHKEVPLARVTNGRIEGMTNTINLAELDERLQKGLCPLYNTCFGETPFADEKCALSYKAKRIECLEFLKEKLGDTKRRVTIVQKYMHNLTTVIDCHDRTHVPPIFFTGNGVLTNAQTVLLKHTVDGIQMIARGAERGLPAILGKSIPEMDGRVICLPLDDFLYLVEHPDYRKVWLEMSNFWTKVFTKEELAEFFESLGEIHLVI